MTRLYANNYSTTLNGAITNVATTITVNSVTGLPAIGSGDTCQLTIDDGTNIEIVTATAVSSFDLTVTRGQEGTSGTAFADGTTIELRATASAFIDPAGEIDFGGATSLEIPNSTTPTVDANGEVAIDTSVTDFSHGVMVYYSGEEVGVVGMPIAQFTTPTDGYVVAYNATNDEFELVAQSGGASAINDLTDVTITSVADNDVLQYNSGGAVWENITFSTFEGSLNHDNLTGFVSNEHIDWTSTTSNFSTSGTVATGELSVTGWINYTQNFKGFKDLNGNEAMVFEGITSAVNYLNFANSATGNAVTFGAAGDDANITLEFYAKGSSGIAYSTGGLVCGSPTGGHKGTGTVNATAVYDDNTLLTCYVFDQAVDGLIDEQKWHNLTPDKVDYKTQQVLEVTQHAPMLKFKSRMSTEYDPMDIDKYAQHWKQKRHLTSMPNEVGFDPLNGLTTGEWIQRLVETVEIQAIHIDQLNQRLKALENK